MQKEKRNTSNPLTRVIDHTKQLCGNTIVAVRFDSNDISDIMQEILVYGTAVVVEKKE